MLYLLKTLFVIDTLMVIGLVLFRWALTPSYKHVVSKNIVALALLTPVVALFCGNIYLFCAYLAVAVAFNSRSRAELAGAFVFIIPMMPILSVETGIGSVYLLAISAVLAMGLGALIGYAITSGRGSMSVPRYDLAVSAITLLFVFIYNRDPSLTTLLRGLTVNVLSFVGPYLLVSRSLRNVQDIERLLLRFCMGGMVLAITACFQARLHWVVFQSYYEALRIPFPMASWSLAMRAGMLRTGGAMLDYSSGGLFLACILAMMPFLRPRFRSTGFWAVVAVIIGGLIASQSRGAWIAAIVGLIFAFAYRGLWGKAALLIGGLGLAEAAILLSEGLGGLAAVTGQDEEASGTISYRQMLASQGMDQIKEHPLLGQSPDRLVENMSNLMQGQHIVDFVNGHLFIAMAAGVPLFLLWCGIWLMPVVDAWRHRKMSGELIGVAAAIMVPAMIALIFTSTIDRNLTWPTLALALAGPCLVIAQRQRKSERGSKAAASMGVTKPKRVGPRLVIASPDA